MAIDPTNLETEEDPIVLKRRILPNGLREPVHKELVKLLNEGIINAVNPSLWASPIVTPLKKDDVTPRKTGLESSKISSVIDLLNAFLQVPLDEASKQLTIISTPCGLLLDYGAQVHLQHFKVTLL